jgi:GT2 family glycosyltransferase
MTNTRLSVITPVYKPRLSELRRCLESARHPLVEHIVVLDGQESVQSLRKLRSVAKSFGARLEVSETQSGISATSNLAASLAIGEFLVFLDQDDFLEDGWVSPLLESMRNSDFIYSDGFIASEAGKAVHLWEKPGWSPTRLIFNMYAVHFMAVRKSIFEQVGGFRSEFDGSQDHDLALRISRITDKFEHIPLKLYNWRESQSSTAKDPENKTWAYDAGQACSQDFLRNFDAGAIVEKIEGYPGALRAVFSKRTLPVSVVIPTAFKADPAGRLFVETLIKSLGSFLDPALGDEIILVHGGEPATDDIDRIQHLSHANATTVADEKEFNFSRRCNIGFLIAQNEHILLLNDDVEFGEGNFLDHLFGLIQLPNVGLVGAMLVFPDFSVQHGGHIFRDLLPNHAHHTGRTVEHGLYDLIVDHEVVGVTGALMFQRRSTWQAVGGFTASLPLSFNDVDYCQKIRSLGFSVLQSNSVVAFHHESSTREPIAEHWETRFIQSRWYDNLMHDEYSSPYR